MERLLYEQCDYTQVLFKQNFTRIVVINKTSLIIRIKMQ